MNKLKKWFFKLFSKNARLYLKSYGLLQTAKMFQKSAIVWEPKGDKILVLAPHFDDETIGCGGTLYKHIKNGGEVSVVFLTDGRTGSKALLNLSGEQRRKAEEALVEMRKKEAKLALEVIGIKEFIFFDIEGSKLASTKEIQDRLKKILHSFKPDIVYLPFFLEEHPEHRITSRILLEATEGTNFKFDCLGYEIWTPLFPNCLVKIDETVEIKKEAIQQYKSQLTDKDYIHTNLGLNAYRSIALLDNNCRFVEAFFRASLKDYSELYNEYCKF